MTHSKFEKYASSKITQHQSSVDTDALWKAIATEAPKRKRRGFLWMYLTGFLTIGMVSGVLWKSTTSSDIRSAGLSDVNKQQTLENPAVPFETEISSDHHTTKEAGSSTPTAIPSLSNEYARLNDTQKVKPSNPPGNYKKKDISTEIELILTDSRTNNDAPTSAPEPVATNTITDQDKTNNDPPTNTPEPEATNTYTVTDLMSRESQAIDNENSPLISLARLPLVHVSLDETQANRALTISPLKSVGQNQLLPNPLPTSRHKIIYSIGAYGGVSATTSTLTAKNSGSDEYLDLRNQTEKQLETIQFGLEVGAEVFNGLTIKSGIEISRIARVFTFNDEIIAIDSVYGLKEIFVNNQTNDTINVYGQVPVITTTEYQKKTYNNITQIDIPIKIGYTFHSEKWRFGLDVGSVINLNTSYTGEILSPNTGFYALNSDPENWFKTNTGIAFTAGVSMGYSLGSSFEIYLAPMYRSASVYSTDANPIKQAHARFGANLGIRSFIGQ